MQSLKSALDASEYSVSEFGKRFKIAPYRVQKYINGEAQPSKKTVAKLEEYMKKILTDSKIPYHPAYGYATREQIAELQSMGMGPNRDRLMAQISQQNDNRGKVYK